MESVLYKILEMENGVKILVRKRNDVKCRFLGMR